MTGKQKYQSLLASLLCVSALSACTPQEEGKEPRSSARVASLGQMLSAGRNADGGTFVRFDVLSRGSDGQPYSCEEGTLKASITVKSGHKGRVSRTSKVEVSCPETSAPDVAVVVDNSGSQQEVVDQVKAATRHLVSMVGKQGGRVSLTRVSTEAKLLAQLSDDTDSVRSSVEELFVNRGWTALYDGVRLASESLGAGQSQEDGERNPGGCGAPARRALVMFTDGADNNSAGEHATGEYPGDSYDTALEDLENLRVAGAQTPIFTVGLGDEVEHERLRGLAEASGGSHEYLKKADELQDTFERLGRYLSPSYQVCAQVPEELCGLIEVEMNYSFSHNNGERSSGSSTQILNVACEYPEPEGRTLSMLLALSSIRSEGWQISQLATSAVRWLSPVQNPSVALVLDDNHHNEHPGEMELILDALTSAGIDVNFIKEPAQGIQPEDVADADVIWFSNPGYPMDDAVSFETLRAARTRGVGVLMQGDDMSAALGRAFDLKELTGVSHGKSGQHGCGLRVDNGKGTGLYALSFENQDVFPELVGKRFTYQDDMDQTSAVQGATVLAHAGMRRVDGANERPCALKTDAIVAQEPQASR